jgi:hypothetical protein
MATRPRVRKRCILAVASVLLISTSVDWVEFSLTIGG